MVAFNSISRNACGFKLIHLHFSTRDALGPKNQLNVAKIEVNGQIL